MPHRTAPFSLIAATLMGLSPLTTQAQDKPAEPDAPAPGVSIELSAAENTGSACRLSFLVTNGHATDIDKAVYEVVLFGTSGGVAQLTLLDFQDLPAGRPRVRQFQFGGLSCDSIPRVLINGAETCTGVAEGGCIRNLQLSTRTDAELIG